ncbi:transcriptional repressor LexA [Aquibacillus salsiterrae]|uniref:DNA 3'-5' helicase n=1 Tax=Aquibacillus salsiterrae TaxID=2950439 RepID=A0A9X3WE69_9BACI|nr:transcriptional repressor LexA [Aquibacillus salsiterrae]MDC3418077.1 transcriptional repressor LexA [Aquibacillus salsiterrae]
MKLNVEQRKIIELEPAGHTLIKGVAGSGKTTVAIRRVSFLQEHYCPEENDNILLVTFNKTLLKYIKYQYENMENEETNSLQSLFTSSGEVFIENIDKLMFSFFKRYQVRHNVRYGIANGREARKLLQQAILLIKEKFPNIKLLTPKNSSFLMDEIDWIKACDIPDLETYQEIDRIGRASGGQGNPQKLTKNSETRTAIFELMELYNELLMKQGLVDFKSMNQLALAEAAELQHQRYTHIIIDESQDLSKIQLKFLKLLHMEKSYASIMFVADNTQSIYSQSWLGKGRPYTTIGYDMSGKARTLSKNYRTTTEISKAAYGLIENDEQIKGNVDFVKPSLIDRHGHAPIYRFFTDAKKQSDFLIEEIKALHSDYELRDICIVAKERRLIDSAAIALERSGFPCEILNDEPKFAANTVKLVTMHSIKGLEFKVIFLINLDADVIPNDGHGMDDEETLTEERKLMYVGMTRANELLYMSSVRKPSCFVKEIDNDYIRVMRDSALRPFQSIPIQDYQLTDQLVDLNAKEEVIRQWIIRELKQTFGYPLELIALEYPVQHFSKRGYVDIVVTIDVDGQKMPYIFAEVKAFASGIDDGFEQLKTYMMANSDVRYGVVTDGVEVKIVDRNGEQVSDIPPCQPQFFPNTKRNRTYIDLRHQKTYQYAQDKDDETNVEVVDAATNLMVDANVDVRVPVIGDVAAGIPITAIEHFQESIQLLDDWVIQQGNTYALRVSGDSMINAGIDKGDLVIVNKQEAVNNGDIVIALIDQEATMKRFMLMGGSILLISENTNYEPIQMNPSDVVINGKVIGVLKG